MSPSHRYRTHFCWVMASALAMLAQLRLIFFVMGSHYGNSIGASAQVLDGTPFWAIYQSRLLGPYTIRLLSALIGDFSLAHVFFLAGMTTLAGYMVLLLADRRFGKQSAWLAFFAFQAFFSFLLNQLWLYAWDQYCIILFLLFVYFVFADKDWRWFSALFTIAILNRESALFMAIWMVVHPIAKAFFTYRHKHWLRHIDKALCLAGILCGTLGTLLILALRKMLLVREMVSAPGVSHNFDIAIGFNIRSIAGELTPSLFFHLTPLFILTCAAVLAISLMKKDPARFFGLGFTFLALSASIFCFGVISESRVMLELIPFYIFGILYYLAPETPSLTASVSKAA
jgi:hypothetical protein